MEMLKSWWGLMVNDLSADSLGDRVFGLFLVLATILMFGMCGLAMVGTTAAVGDLAVGLFMDPPVDYCYTVNRTHNDLSAWVIYGHRPWTSDMRLWAGDFNNAVAAWPELGCVGPMVGPGVGAAP